MGLYDKMFCAGPTGCGHPRYEHTGTQVKGSRSACRHKLAQGRGACACTRFKVLPDDSPDSKPKVEAVHG